MSMGGSKPKLMNTQTPGQQQMSRDLYYQIQSHLGKPLDQYSGQLVPGLDPGYDQVRGMLNNYDPNQYAAAQSGAINRALSGQSSYQLDPTTTANWFRDAVTAPSMRNYQQTVSPQIDQGFAGTGGLFSTARGFAKQNALSNMQAQNSAQLAQQQMQNQGLAANLAESAANRQQQAISGHYAAAPLFDAAAMEQALSPFQQNAQQQDLAQYQEFLRTRPEANQYMQMAQAFLGQNALAAYQPTNPYAGLIGAGVGAAGQIGGGVLGAMSSGAQQPQSNPNAPVWNIQDSAPSPALGIGGGALSGAGTGAMFGPWGALIGAGLGAAGGYLAGR